jgi:hypothetical protein
MTLLAINMGVPILNITYINAYHVAVLIDYGVQLQSIHFDYKWLVSYAVC